jgi:O-antigen/teichoic acid export membrane protein
MAAAIAATWIAGLWQLLSLRRRLRERLAPGPRLYRPRTWLRVAFPQLLMDSFYLLLTYCDVIILERFVEPDAVAIYYAATKLVSIVAFVYFSVAAAATHKFTQLHVTGRPDELKAFMRAAIGWTFLPSLAMGIVILLLGKPLLAMFGPSFPSAYPLLPALLVGLLARASIGPVEKLLSMVGHQGACAYVYAFAFATNIALSVALVPRLGLMGAAVATSTALILESILLFVLAKQLLSIHVFYWGAAKKRPS